MQLLGWRSAEAHSGLGKTKNGEDVSGSINVPEVAHDTEPEDYVVCFPRGLALGAYVPFADGI